MDRTSVSRREFMFATRPAQSLAYVGGQPPKGLRGFGVRPRRSGTWQATSGRSKGAYRGSEELELVVGIVVVELVAIALILVIADCSFVETVPRRAAQLAGGGPVADPLASARSIPASRAKVSARVGTSSTGMSGETRRSPRGRCALWPRTIGRCESTWLGGAGQGGNREVEVGREPPAGAGIRLVECGAALESDQRENATLGQMTQQQILGDVDDRGIATLWRLGRRVAQDVALGQPDVVGTVHATG